MASKQEKIKAWLIEQKIGAKRIELISDFIHCVLDDVDRIIKKGFTISGVNRDGVLIPLPDFQDDQPEPKDKALQEYIKYNKGVVCMDAILELAERVKALEAKTLSNYMEDYPTAKLKEAANEKA